MVSSLSARLRERLESQSLLIREHLPHGPLDGLSAVARFLVHPVVTNTTNNKIVHRLLGFDGGHIVVGGPKASQNLPGVT